MNSKGRVKYRVQLQTSSFEVENLNEQFKIQTMNFGGERTPYPLRCRKLPTNADRTRMFTKAEWLKSTILTIFVAIFF